MAQAADDPSVSYEQRLLELETELQALRSERQVSEPRPSATDGQDVQQAGYASFLEQNGATQQWRPPAVPQFFTRTEYPTVNWSGFLQLDNGDIVQDETNEATVGTIEPQFGLRRVRLRAFGDIREHTHYVVDLDFAASGHPSFRDVYLGFRSVPYVQNAALGYYKQPFGMDAESSGQELLFMERQPPFAFAPFRQTGMGVNGTGHNERLTYRASFYAFPTDSFGVSAGDGMATSARITGLPYLDEERGRLMHLGVGYGIGDPSDSMVRYAIEPSFFVTDPATDDGSSVPVFVDTGDIPTRLFQLLNFELAGAAGPIRWQAETRFAFVDQIGGPGLAFSGSYFQIGWVLTGERPEYDRRRAIFHRVVPDEEFDFGPSGCGAWELAAGWSVIDLDNRNVAGGKMSAWTFGLNWYMSEYTRFMLNCSPVFLDDATFGRSRASVIATRFQAAF